MTRRTIVKSLGDKDAGSVLEKINSPPIISPMEKFREFARRLAKVSRRELDERIEMDNEIKRARKNG